MKGRRVTLINADCLDALSVLPPASVDAIVTDPPYEIGLNGNRWDKSGIAYSVPLWTDALRVAKPGSYLLAFGAARTFHRMTSAIEDAGFEIVDCIAWMYGNGFPKHRSKLKPAWEPIVVGWKRAERSTPLRIEDSRVNGRWPSNVILDEAAAEQLDADWTKGKIRPSRFFYIAKPTTDEREAGMGMSGLRRRRSQLLTGLKNTAKLRFNDHPTVKPIDLMRHLVRLITPVGGIVLDPFTGSGTTGCAAMLENVRFVGIEKEKRFYRIAETRIRHWQRKGAAA